MKVNIVIMGQSGNGKSTIVNAILGQNIAETGKGGAVTKENKLYSTLYNNDDIAYELNLYDTVGLELSESVTRNTLDDVKKHIIESQKNSNLTDVNLVWFCINNRGSRIQDFEIDLIKKLSLEYEIPFIIVMTQCFDNQIGDLENSIRSEIPEIVTTRILAKDYSLRGGTIVSAFGLEKLLRISVSEYNRLKVHILETKLNELQKEVDVSEWYIESYKRKAKASVESHVESATKIGWIPIGCIPFVHGICIKMINELHKIYGLPSNEKFAENIFVNVIVGIIVTPLMIIPILSAATAYSYVSTVGEEYLEALNNVLRESKYGDLQNQMLMTERIKQQLNQRKGK